MSKIKLTGSNSGYVEIDSAADAGNLTLTLPTSGVRLLSNTDNVFSGITTTAELDINGKIDVSTDIVGGRNLKVTGITTLSDDLTLTGASYNVLWDKSDNQLEFGTNAKLSFGASSDLQLYHNGSNSMIEDHGTGNLEIRTVNGTKVTLQGGGNPMVNALKDAQVELYFNNSKKIETTNTGAVVTGICTATSFSGDGSNLTGLNTPLSFRNLIINGAMMVAQRGTSVASTGYKTCDRWQFGGNWPGSAITQEQATIDYNTVPYDQGFRKSYKITNSSQSSASAGDNIEITYSFEGQEIANSGWDFVNNTKYITLSFWVKSSVAQTFYGYFRTFPGTDLKYSFPIVCSTTGWEFKTVSIKGETNFAQNVYNSFPNTSSRAMVLRIVPYYGTTYTDSGAINNAWRNYSSADITPVYDTSWFLTNGATFELTGVQLEVGDTATAFEHRSFPEELQRCQRYYEHSYNYGTTPGTASNSGSVMFLTNRSPGTAHTMLRYMVRKRTAPTLVAYDPTQSNTTGMRDLDNNTTYNYTMNRNGEMGCTAYPTGNLGLGYFIQFHYTADAEL